MKQIAEKETALRRQTRQEKILSRLRAIQTELTVEHLAETFGVSALTIRRELDQLEREGMIVRTHGGCLLRNSVESAYHRRVALNFELKEAIGRAASEELGAARTILINDGSTTFHLATRLHDKRNLSVYTNSMAMVRELNRCTDVRVFVLGGELDRDQYLLGGNLTELVLESLYFDIVFLGADAVDQSGSCLVPTVSEARLTQIMLRRGRRKVLLADHTKCQAESHAAYARLSDFDLWITTPGMPKALLGEFRKLLTIKEATL